MLCVILMDIVILSFEIFMIGLGRVKSTWSPPVRESLV